MPQGRNALESEEFERFREYLAGKAVDFEIIEEPEALRVHFYFTTHVKRITKRTLGIWGWNPFDAVVYEPEELFCRFPMSVLELYRRSAASVIEELTAFVTQEFHLDEERFTFGAYEYTH